MHCAAVQFLAVVDNLSYVILATETTVYCETNYGCLLASTGTTNTQTIMKTLHRANPT